MPPFSSDAGIDYVGSGLLKRTLPKSEWTHAAHFAAAFLKDESCQPLAQP